MSNLLSLFFPKVLFSHFSAAGNSLFKEMKVSAFNMHEILCGFKLRKKMLIDISSCDTSIVWPPWPRDRALSNGQMRLPQ